MVASLYLWFHCYFILFGYTLVARHLNENDILYGLQHDFREKRSCETQLLELVEESCRKVSNCNQVDLV